MSMSLRELERAVAIVETQLVGSRLQKIIQPEPFTLVLACYGQGTTTHLLLGCEPGAARLSAVPSLPRAPATPPQVVQYLRAHADNARLVAARILDGDRQAALRFEGGDNIVEIVLSILGPRSNVYVLDRDATVSTALRPFAETRRDLGRGVAWKSPESPPPAAGGDRWAEVADADYLEAVERTYSAERRRTAAQETSRRIGHALRREIAFHERREANLERGRTAALEAAQHQRTGELLKTVLHTVRQGDAFADAVDHVTGETVRIPLDPTRSPAASLEGYFKRYHKGAAGAGVLAAQLEETRRARAELGDLLKAFQSLPTVGPESETAVEAFAKRTRVARIVERHYSARKTQATPPPRRERRTSDIPARLRPKRYATADGLEIWVGRNDDGNDYLTTRLARGNDLFFHLDGSPGSHVILRTGGRKDPPSEAILDACELAVHFSKQRDAGRADVHVAAIKDVKKPSGAKPGLVHVYRGKTVHLRRDSARLARILDAKIGD